ncbi:hypothetical protein SVI_0733 [Shewanella violacea DSS12]|uniref:Uncharacterized protein n=1 Tax=Shewanella violacea (strain JCM 10179 / CIP 106290 / LMG 19151 / DSS12) TaxID=637905 RepID=D4ZGA5_SHEVD|nr:hypothetical protein SVI_0733 [Shewanella violacea DSS12]
MSYDRFTTRFKITSNGELAYSKLLLFWPIHKAKLTLPANQQSQGVQQAQQYDLRIFWFIIWSAKLSSHQASSKQDSSKKSDISNQVVIPELLELRRRKTIGVLIYSSCMGLLRLILKLAS